MPRGSVRQACSATLEKLGQRLVAARSDPASALRTAFSTCMCYLSPVCYLDQERDEGDDGLARKALVDGPLK